MATIQQLESALRNAHAAGDVAAAAKLANAIKDARGRDFSVAETVKNIPGSAAQLAKDMIQPILSPVETAKGLQSAAQGLVEKVLPKPEVSGFEWGATQNEQNVDAIGQFIVDRYGSIDAFKSEKYSS